VPKRVRRSTLRRRGITVRVRATEPVRHLVTLSGRRRGSTRRVTLARWQTAGLRRTVSVRLRPTRRVLARAGRGVLRLDVRLRDAAGNTGTLRALVRLR